jgi:DNA (cytosine-5)-methyltransferase 1
MLYKPRQTAISLFSGAGGCSSGFQQAGFNILYAQDIDKDCIESYSKNFFGAFCEVRDIRDTDFGNIKRKIGHVEIDVVIGGPPCQGFSTAGSRNAHDPRNKLLGVYVDALKIIKPKWFLFENVEGILTLNNGEYIENLVKKIINLGYTIRIEKIYAQEFNIPQRRKRVIIVGNKMGINFKFPIPKAHASGNIFRASDHTLRLAIGSLPHSTNQKGASVQYSAHPKSEFEKYIRGNATQLTEHYAPIINGIQLERLQLLSEGCTMKDLPEHLQHESFKKRSLRRVMDGTPSEKRGGAPSGLKRLFFDEPSLTITSSSTRELIHPQEHRPLTIRECARIQTFRDDFIFCGNESSKIKQIGNAIPPLLAYEFASHIRRLIESEDCCTHKFDGLLGFKLTKAGAMSPALQSTTNILSRISSRQGNLFEVQ